MWSSVRATGGQCRAFALVVLLLLAGCSTPNATVGGPPIVSGIVTAGPLCPVAASPDPSMCDPRPVAGAVVVATDVSGLEIGRDTTSTDGRYTIWFAKSEPVVITALPVKGLARPPDPVKVTITLGVGLTVNLMYDTGIR